MSLVPGVNRLEALIEAQNTATEQHRNFEGETLRALETDVGEIKTLAQTTNGRVNEHDIQLALIKRDEEQAALMEAARLKAAGDKKAANLSWWQLAVSGVAGAVLLLIVSIVVFYVTGSGVH